LFRATACKGAGEQSHRVRRPVKDLRHQSDDQLSPQVVLDFPRVAIARSGTDQLPNARDIAVATETDDFQVVEMPKDVLRQFGYGAFVPQPNS
jgi:hypothetical protein